MLPNGGPGLGVGDGEGDAAGNGDGDDGDTAKLAGAVNAKSSANAINSKILLRNALNGEQGAPPARRYSKNHQTTTLNAARRCVCARTSER
jgi:hypothetical protein